MADTNNTARDSGKQPWNDPPQAGIGGATWDRNRFTPEWLEETCAEWQARLRLQDWEVVIRFERAENMADSWGLNSVFPEKKACSVRILQPSDRTDEGEYAAPPVEETLIHELLHLHFLPWATNDSEDPNYLILEQGVGIIAQALYRAARG